MAKSMMPKIRMETYKPDPKVIEQALWGRDKPPTAKEQEADREKLQKQIVELHKIGKKKPEAS